MLLCDWDLLGDFFSQIILLKRNQREWDVSSNTRKWIQSLTKDMIEIYRSPFWFILFFSLPRFPFDLVGWLSYWDKRHISDSPIFGYHWPSQQMCRAEHMCVWVSECVHVCLEYVMIFLHCNDYAKNYFEDSKLTRQHFTRCW